MIHFGKHGNLEWLPGKSVALSEECFPEAVLGPLPHLYPFIVNDPGEGTQAKRRTPAASPDHLAPPLTRADTYRPPKEPDARSARLPQQTRDACHFERAPPMRSCCLARSII